MNGTGDLCLEGLNEIILKGRLKGGHVNALPLIT